MPGDPDDPAALGRPHVVRDKSALYVTTTAKSPNSFSEADTPMHRIVRVLLVDTHARDMTFKRHGMQRFRRMYAAEQTHRFAAS